MPDGFFFGGTFTRRPSVRVLVNTQGLNPLTPGSLLIPAFVGQALGGQPGVPLFFQTPAQAIATLRGGELLTAVLRAFNPSKTQPGASVVVAVRVNPADPAFITIQDAATNDSITLNAVNWGAIDNQTSVLVEAGSSIGTKITLQDINGNKYVGDNLGEAAFSVQYVGLSVTVTITVSNTSITFTSSGSDGFVVDLTTYTTVQQVVNFINGQVGYVASVLTTKPNAPALNGLDGAVTQDVIATPFTVRRDLQAIIDWINGGSQPLVTAVRPGTGDAIPADGGPFFLGGGAEIGNTHLDGSANIGHTIDNVEDWTFAGASLSTQPVSFVTPIMGAQTGSNEDALNLIFDALAVDASANVTLQRYNILGAQLGESGPGSTATVIAHAKLLNSSRSAYVPLGFQDYDDVSKALTSYPGYMLAAEVAGVFCGIANIGDSATGLDLRGTALEWLPSATDLENLLAGGCLPCEFDTTSGFIRVTRAITTWLRDNNFAFVEISTGICLDLLVSMLTIGLKIFKGKKAGPDILSRIASKITTLLTQAQTQGIIVGDSSSPAWDNLVMTIQDDQAIGTLDASPGIPLNFIGLTINATAFTGTIAVSSTQNTTPPA